MGNDRQWANVGLRRQLSDSEFTRTPFARAMFRSSIGVN